MSARLVAIKRYRETSLRAERRRRVERPGAQLFLTLALGAGARDQRHDMAWRRVADLGVRDVS